MLSDLRYRLRALFRARELDGELEEELAFHVEQARRKHERAGLAPREAARRARLEFGGVEQVRQDVRSVRGVALVEALQQDLRYAWRGMAARPGFTLAIVLTLGLAIGANTTMFGVVDRLLVRGPAFMDAPERVHRVYWRYRWDGRENTVRNFEYRRYMQVRDEVGAFERIAAFSNRPLPVGARGETQELPVSAVSAGFFELFSMRPALGRFFGAADDAEPAGRNVTVLSWTYWQSAYGGRSDVLGGTIAVGETTYEIVGVAPAGFAGLPEADAPVLFVPITAMAWARRPTYAEGYNWSWLEIVARRRADVSQSAAEAELTAALARSWEAEREGSPSLPPLADAGVNGLLAPVHFARGPDARADARVAAWLMGVAAIVLLVACANVMNLLLLRALNRRREIGLRLALGVTRGRLVQQLLVETSLLALLGGGVALLFAKWGGATLRTLLLPAQAADAVGTDTRTLLFTAVLTLAVALLAGLAPARQALRADVADALKAGDRTASLRAPLRTGLVLLQGTLCVVLLIGAGLFTRSLLNVRAFRLGYDTAPVLLVNGNWRGTELPDAQRNELADRLVAAVQEVPGVVAATLATSMPFYSFEGRGTPRVPGRDSLNLLGSYTLQIGSPSYFRTIGTRIVRGRGFDGGAGTVEPVVVVSAAMAAALWPDADAIGQQLGIGPDSLPLLTVIGVAEDVAARRLVGGPPSFWYYLPAEQYKRMFGALEPALFVRVAGDARDFAEPVRERLQREMPGEAYVRARPLMDVIEPQQRSWRLGATMFVLFAGLALVLATIGLYSVIAYTVAQRTRELGVRIALGAGIARVVRMVIAQGFAFAVIAIIAGAAVAGLAANRVQPLLFDASARDPLVYGGVAIVLLVIALFATAGPAWRASRVDPTVALRAE